MVKNKLPYLLSICVFVCIYPVLADNLPTLISQPVSVSANLTASSTNANVATTNTNADKILFDGKTISTTPSNSLTPTINKTTKATLPKKVFSVATALVIGTPVCIVRRTKYEEWYGVNGMVGDSTNKCKKVLAGIFWLPWAVICGTGEAPFDAVANGLMYPAFTKDQLSQGKLVQNN
jgi:hypothetical protein